MRPPDWVEQWHVVDIPTTTRFRGITRRRALLVKGPAGWAEWSPFEEYGPQEAFAWWRACTEQATLAPPPPLRHEVPVNVTVPAEDAEHAAARVRASGCRTAKVKVAQTGQDPHEDIERLEAVREALGPSGRLRCDANGGWSVEQALAMITSLRHLGLEYVEQPCATTEELAELRARIRSAGWEVPIAADESIRRSGDPEKVVALGAADVAVLKVQPLGGARACLALAERLGLPVVISSALETSIGLSAGLACAGALPGLDHACGLNTSALLADDVVPEPLVDHDGVMGVPTHTPEPDPERLARLAADEQTTAWWLARWQNVLDLEAAR